MSPELIKVVNNPDTMPWIIFVDGFFRRNIEKRMQEDDISPEAIENIFSNAARILNKCPDPKEKNNIAETGIIIGKVQSGKTSNFISVLSLAFDNGYDIAIVLGGNTLELLKQNATRISSAFNVDTDKLTVLKTNDNKLLISPQRIKEFIENGRKIIIVGLKHYKHINQIAEIFENPYLSEKSVLIIDDEGDQATLNTRAYLESMSSTYESVVNLKAKLKSHCFLSITATPQANILIKVFDTLSPDFGELVYPGEGYCGLQEFHGENADKFVYEIPETEGNLLDETGVPASVYKAMAMFFVGNAIRRCRGDFRNHAMLIHPSQKKFDHNIVVSKIDSVLDSWKSKAKIRLSGKNDISYQTLYQDLFNAYDAFCNDGVITVPFSDLEITTLNIIKQCSPVHKCNSDENASENSKLYKTNIFVGGNLVERGITIKGLAITYITRRAKTKSNVDNTEQRARWFGYKADFLDVCRVFTTKDIKDDFASILEHDEDMWSSIERARDRGIGFKDMPRIFYNARSAFLNLTRKNVARTEQYELSEWKPQKFLIIDKKMVDQNNRILSEYREKRKQDVKLVSYNPVQKHAFLSNLQYRDLYRELLLALNYACDEILSKEYFNILYEALEKLSLNPIVDLVWVRDIQHTTRKINEDGTIQQLFQGRNPNKATATYYEGDRSLADDEPEHMQIQIHHVKPNNIEGIDYYSPVLALYVPDWCARKLANLVVPSNG